MKGNSMAKPKSVETQPLLLKNKGKVNRLSQMYRNAKSKETGADVAAHVLASIDKQLSALRKK